MAELRLSLEEGFAGDHVVVSADGTTVLDDADLSTRLQTGLATTVDVSLDAPGVLRVELPGRGIGGDITVDPTATPYVRASVVGDEVELTATESPPFYA